MTVDTPYNYPGARTMVLLHDEQMRLFVATWKRASSSTVRLPTVDDPDYVSYNSLLRHVLRASRGYLVWICKQLALADPKIDPAPESDLIGAVYDDYLVHILDRWREPLREVPEERFYQPEYVSHWRVKYCIDAMLEHAVMHPIRHRFQLEELLDKE